MGAVYTVVCAWRLHPRDCALYIALGPSNEPYTDPIPCPKRASQRPHKDPTGVPSR